MSKKAYLLETDVAERIDRFLREKGNGRVCLPFDGTCFDGDPQNLYRVLLTENGKRLLSYAKTEEHFLSDSYSDYENFIELLHLFPSLVGSGYHRFVRLALEVLLGFSEIPKPSDADALWKASLPILRDGALDDLLSPFRDRQMLDVSAWIFPSRECLATYEGLDDYVSAYKRNIEGVSMLWLDVSELAFISPDPYHAVQGFSSIKDGDGDVHNRTYLSSQLLRVTGELCKIKSIPLVLSGEFPVAAVKDLIQYLRRMDRMPRLFYAMPFDDGRALVRTYEVLEDAGLLSLLYGILPHRLPYCSTDALTESLHLSAMRYPLGRLVFVAEGTTAAEVRMGYEGFRRVLSSFLSDSVCRLEISEAEAIAVGDRILTADVLQC